ncbi:Transposon Ty3-I Gag-Pol polyprotein [Labeo rohita]|uniref:Gypsy retrotransposon integrase-like protein 1 n=1 Tax=Labeo rohita TaxID=84645 RepID=A0ABQ8L2J0_LABRO|nr:Transposon Ty3-I Gag-Pol polyprotein [Labeo rohita]
MSTEDPFQELVDSLRRVLLRPAVTMSPPPTCESSPSPSTSSPPVPSSRPAPYSGRAEECNGFLLQCPLTFTIQPTLYPTDQSKIAFIISLLSGSALQWAETLWLQTGPATQTIQSFITHFKEVFGQSNSAISAGEQLYHLKQGTMSIHEYSLKFTTLAAASGWNERSLLTTYRLGLEPKLRLQLAALDDHIGLEKFIQHSIRCSDRMTSYLSEETALLRRPEQNSPPEPATEPMIIDSGKLSSTERQRRLTRGLCLYCGGSGHMKLNCPSRPRRTWVSVLQSETEKLLPLTTNVIVTTVLNSVTVTALIDSGSAGNFISGTLCRQLKLRTFATSTKYQIHSITGELLSRKQVQRQCDFILLQLGLLHKEQTQLLVLESATVDIILGRPWLVKHNPIISWGTGEVLRWGEDCNLDCFPDLPQPVKKSIPRASQLPPHRPWDCAIDLVPKASLPKGRIYPLSLPESQEYIRPSTSPAASSFFFVSKKDGGLRPCIDYRVLNHHTIKIRYLLPLVPAALEQLRSAVIFTKLDLRSAYNLIRIRKGDEWKTAFVTPTGHYEYQVMPYGLVNAPSVFQNFIHEVLREFLHHFVIVYIDDILIYPNSEAEHPHHIAEVLQRLREHQLYLKAEKCSFHQKSVQFLGYIIDHHGVRMDEGKVVAVVAWPKPNSIKELQRFLGFANFYLRFIKGKLSPAERNYDIGNRELLAIKLALEEWRHWLEGANHPFQVITDHKNLQYLRDAKRLCPRQARWALFFTRFNFSISYRPGSKNIRADALSRLYEVVTTPEPRVPPGCPPGCKFIPAAQRVNLIHTTHISLGMGHPGANNTLSLLADRFWWPDMARDVRSWKAPSLAHTEPVLVTPRCRFYDRSDENTCILVIVDRFSKFCQLIPLRGLPTALETAECLFNHVFRYYGLPEDIVSDRGSQFISRVWKAFFKLLGVTVSLSSGYHPQTNGQTERKIQEVGRFLCTFCHGFQPPLFPWNGEPSDVPAVDHWFWESERVWDTAHHHLQRAVNRSKAVTDRRRIPGPNFTPGQKVWLSTRDIRLRLPSKKLSPRFIGPFTILEQVNPVTYRLQLPPQYRIHPTFHVSLPKPCHKPLLPSTEPGQEEEPRPPLLEEGSIYSVNEILQSRRRGGRLEYLVDWEGYGPEERSWVPRDDILDPTLISEFHAAHPEYPAPRGRGRPPRRRRFRPSGVGRGEGG